MVPGMWGQAVEPERVKDAGLLTAKQKFHCSKFAYLSLTVDCNIPDVHSVLFCSLCLLFHPFWVGKLAPEMQRNEGHSLTVKWATYNLNSFIDGNIQPLLLTEVKFNKGSMQKQGSSGGVGMWVQCRCYKGIKGGGFCSNQQVFVDNNDALELWNVSDQHVDCRKKVPAGRVEMKLVQTASSKEILPQLLAPDTARTYSRITLGV